MRIGIVGTLLSVLLSGHLACERDTDRESDREHCSPHHDDPRGTARRGRRFAVRRGSVVAAALHRWRWYSAPPVPPEAPRPTADLRRTAVAVAAAGVTAVTTVVTTLVLAVTVAGCSAERPTPSPIVVASGTGGLPAEISFLAQVDRTMGRRGMFPVLRDPPLKHALEVSDMAHDEPVLGLDLGRVQVAYPLNLLNHHEIVEHDLEGLHLLACW